jgi:hypothetical protein
VVTFFVASSTQVIWYRLIAFPPLEGAVHATVTVPSIPTELVTGEGAPGTVKGVADMVEVLSPAVAATAFNVKE